MRRDLAFLPAWYASAGDRVWVEEEPSEAFRRSIGELHLPVEALTERRCAATADRLEGESVSLWGISPRSVYLLEQLGLRHGFLWQLPVWREEFRRLGSRRMASEVLGRLKESVAGIELEAGPRFVSHMEELEAWVAGSVGRWLIKSPFSSSGRGLVWLSPKGLGRSERQIIGGVLRRQSEVSVERALERVLDFSMQFELRKGAAARFLGYSVFRTNDRGAYLGSVVASQEVLEGQIVRSVDGNLLAAVRERLLSLLQEVYGPCYEGVLGVDMLVYRSEGGYGLHPCVEINMRRNMGYLSIALNHNYLHRSSAGCLQINCNWAPGAIWERHRRLKEQHPAVWRDGRMLSGYVSLCPVEETNNYHAYLLAKEWEES
jgi:hypothetical protein